MTGKILVTQEAMQAIDKMKNIIEGPLLGDIKDLNSQGTILSNPMQWEGGSAVQFRAEWQEVYASLQKTQTFLASLQSSVKRFHADIWGIDGRGF